MIYLSGNHILFVRSCIIKYKWKNWWIWQAYCLRLSHSPPTFCRRTKNYTNIWWLCCSFSSSSQNLKKGTTPRRLKGVHCKPNARSYFYYLKECLIASVKLCAILYENYMLYHMCRRIKTRRLSSSERAWHSRPPPCQVFIKNRRLQKLNWRRSILKSEFSLCKNMIRWSLNIGLSLKKFWEPDVYEKTMSFCTAKR